MEPEVDRDSEEGEVEGGSTVTPLEIVAFLGSAAKRHVKLGILVGILLAVLGIAVAFTIPPKYEAESRILASQSAAVTAALSNPSRPVNLNNGDPFVGSTEILKQKSNLLWLAQNADLVTHWKATRSIPFRVKDRIFAALLGSYSDEQKMVALAESLEQRMRVTHWDANVLTIHVEWRDPVSAWKLAQLAQSRFLDLQRSQELAVINAAISVNEDEARRAAEGIDQALGELMHVRERARDTARPHDASPDPAESKASTTIFRTAASTNNAAAAVPAPPDKKLAARLAEIRQQAQEIEAPWRRRLAELNFQLSDLRGTYGPEHPLVLQQQGKIRTASTPPSELKALRDREHLLLSELGSSTVEASAPVTQTSSIRSGSRIQLTSVQAQKRPSDETAVLSEREREENPVLAPAKASLASAIQRYAEVTRRLDSARVELASAQVALQYRYVVVGEPELPRGPTKPNRPLLALAAILAAAIAGLLSGAIRDLLSGRIFEPWQITSLGLQVIGDVTLNAKSKS